MKARSVCVNRRVDPNLSFGLLYLRKKAWAVRKARPAEKKQAAHQVVLLLMELLK
ncbi:hypothetical protein [Deefgea piscis]|uniref:hypothetical protein n=1 Tax=Deefgea piscis TaxID=2739061 RepID=UPI001C81006D|nr:hypothetical protein [Deefgea piscis]QZA80200.1 hypothetical protein K4H25_11720 [Deefgea piscis]